MNVITLEGYGKKLIIHLSFFIEIISSFVSKFSSGHVFSSHVDRSKEILTCGDNFANNVYVNAFSDCELE